jgi:hypothetical protein
MTDKQKSVLTKIKAIIDDTPYEGERESATAMFNRLCKKYGIEPSDFESEEMTIKWIKIPKDKGEKLVINQTVWKIHEERLKRQPSLWSNGNPGYKNKLGIKLTNSELIELSAYVDFYLKAYRRELEIFTSAFIQANDLGIDSEFLGSSREEKLFYGEEELKVMKLSSALEKNEYYARIGRRKK